MTDDVDGRVRRGQESREARRVQIKATALAVFSDKGYHETSVSDLVDAAGVARGTFYLYFDSKEAIFLELLDDLTVHLRSNIVGVDVTRGVASMGDQLHAVVVRILRAVVDNRPLTRIIFREAVGLHATVDARLRAFDDELHGYVARSLQLGAALGVIRPVDPQVAAAAVVGSVREIVHRYVVRADAPFDPDAVARALLDHHLRGLLVDR
ncbi:MAG: TetR/AcrR family transcriptional regulator [Myxococcota bacterium]